MLQAHGTQQDISATRPDIANTLETTVMTVRDLEDRIDLLKNDVFQLSTQLGHQRAAEVAASPSRFAALRTPGLAGPQAASVGGQQSFAGPQAQAQALPHASNPQQAQFAPQQGPTVETGPNPAWAAMPGPVGRQQPGSVGQAPGSQSIPGGMGMGTAQQIGIHGPGPSARQQVPPFGLQNVNPYAQQATPQPGLQAIPQLAGQQIPGLGMQNVNPYTQQAPQQPSFQANPQPADQQIPQFGVQSGAQPREQAQSSYTIQIPGRQDVGQAQRYGQIGISSMQHGTRRII